ncbi:response regulator [Methylobacterium sp. CCH7-A2]|uniref:response regulator n=1 Tax=Methylobacterium sp. CCH7-A2 TaxID=1768789 RepID=UPI0009EB0D7B|nr:response regulator [Methylobacterium sp. CCH7-A2]
MLMAAISGSIPRREAVPLSVSQCRSLMAEQPAIRGIVAIVDDDPFIRTALGRLVRSVGDQAETFANAHEVLAYAALPQLFCVLADLQMPDMNGFELIQVLAESAPGLPVVAMTAYSSDAIRQRAIEAGAAAYLSKPFDAKQLEDCLQDLGMRGGR